MSVHQRKDGRWFVSFKIDGRGKTKSFGRGLESERQAREFNESLGLRSWVRRTPAAGSIQFSELVNEYAAAKANQFPKESMDNFLWKMAGVVLPELGHLPVMRITDNTVDRYVAKRLKSVKATTVNRDLADIQAILNWAAQRRYIAFNPIAGYQKPRRDDSVFNPPSQSEIMRILKHCPEHLMRALHLSFYTGLRPGRRELFSLTWDSVDMESGTILIISARKGGSQSRTVPLHPGLIEKMYTWQDGCPYIIHYRGRRIASLKGSWQTAKKKAGITRRLRLYDFRHAFASYTLRAGSDLKATSELLGHTRIDTTARIYHHTNWDLQKAVIENLPELGND